MTSLPVYTLKSAYHLCPRKTSYQQIATFSDAKFCTDMDNIYRHKFSASFHLTSPLTGIITQFLCSCLLILPRVPLLHTPSLVVRVLHLQSIQRRKMPRISSSTACTKAVIPCPLHLNSAEHSHGQTSSRTGPHLHVPLGSNPGQGQHSHMGESLSFSKC